MDNNYKQSIPSILHFLIPSSIAAFPWGQSIIEQFYHYTKKLRLQLNIIYNWKAVFNLPPHSLLIVYGVFPEWEDEFFSNPALNNLRLVLIDPDFTIMENHKYHKFNNVILDQSLCIQYGLDLLQKQGKTNTALFGCQETDSSDMIKVQSFTQMASASDVYSFSEDIDACFHRFLQHISLYDSVICANDLIACYLIKKLHEYNISIPEQLHLIGMANLTISSHITPTITTCYHDPESIASVAVWVCMNHSSISASTRMNIFLNPYIIERESTNCGVYYMQKPLMSLPLYHPEPMILNCARYAKNSDLLKLKEIDSFLSSCTLHELQMLQGLINGDSYARIAESIFFSQDTVKYHIKKLYRILGIHKRQELIDLAEEYQLCFFPYQ